MLDPADTAAELAAIRAKGPDIYRDALLRMVDELTVAQRIDATMWNNKCDNLIASIRQVESEREELRAKLAELTLADERVRNDDAYIGKLRDENERMTAKLAEAVETARVAQTKLAMEENLHRATTARLAEAERKQSKWQAQYEHARDLLEKLGGVRLKEDG
jgi:chromosome segregation ATPase